MAKCQPGINHGVGITRKYADLRALARKAHKNPTKELLLEIKNLKSNITENKKIQQDHQESCPTCKEE